MDEVLIEKAQTTLYEMRAGNRPRLGAARNLVVQFYKGYIMMDADDLARLKTYFGCVECLNRD